MSTSRQTFDQVKSILGKLDRSIDAARARRLDASRPPAPSAPAATPAPAASPAPAPADARPAYGQARPLRPTPGFGTGAAVFTGRADHTSR